jgi:MFS family permease
MTTGAGDKLGGGRTRGGLAPRSAIAFVVLVGTVSLFSDATYEGGRSLVGQFLEILGSSAAAVGIAAGAGEFLGYGVRFISGYAADRTGAYWRIAFLGYALNLLAMPTLALVGQWQVAIALLFLERVGKGIRNPPRDAMLSYATTEMGRGWGYGLHEAMDQIGAFLGPLLVALVLYLNGGDHVGIAGYHTAFLVLIVPAIAAIGVLVAARHYFPRPRDLESKTPKVSTQGFDRRFWLFVIAAGFVAAGSADFALVAFHFQSIRLVADDTIPILFALAMAIDAGAALVLGRLFDRLGFGVLLVAVGVGAAFAPFAFSSSLPLVLVGLALWGIGLSAEESIFKAALTELIPPDRRAYGFGLYATVFGLFWFAGSATMGLLYDQAIAWLVIFSVTVQLVALPVFVLARRTGRPDAATLSDVP